MTSRRWRLRRWRAFIGIEELRSRCAKDEGNVHDDPPRTHVRDALDLSACSSPNCTWRSSYHYGVFYVRYSPATACIRAFQNLFTPASLPRLPTPGQERARAATRMLATLVARTSDLRHRLAAPITCDVSLGRRACIFEAKVERQPLARRGPRQSYPSPINTTIVPVLVPYYHLSYRAVLGLGAAPSGWT